MKVHRKEKIAVKLARMAVAITLAIGFIVGFIQVGLDFLGQARKQDRFMNQILIVLQPAATEAAYTLNTRGARELLNGLMKYEFIIEATLVDDRGTALAAVNQPLKTHRYTRRITEILLGKHETFTIALHRPGSKRIRYGELTILVDRDTAMQDFYTRSLILVISGIVRNLILVFALLAIFYGHITQPLVRIADAFNTIRPDEIGRARLPLIRKHKYDELGRLIRSVNRLFRAFQNHLAELGKAEIAVRESEEKYRQLFESESDALLVIDAESLFIEQANSSAVELYGYTLDEFPKLTAVDLSAEKEKTPEAVARAGRDEPGSRKIPSRRFLKKDGSIFTGEISIGVFETGGRKKIIGAIRDITDRKRIEEQLRHSQKMESIGTLAGGIAHDFNNILAAIIGYTELSLDELPPESVVYRHMKSVLTAGERAKSLVNQILMFSRRNDHQLKPVQIRLIVKETLKLLRASLPSTIEIRTEMLSDAYVLGDPTQIHQIFMNLCTNAGQAMQENGGILKVGLLDTEIDAASLAKYPGVSPGLFVKLSIGDTGHGISPDILNRIFDPFFTTKEVGKGTGMGLSVVHGIVSASGGFVTVYSEPGAGTTFNVFLPVLKTDNTVVEQDADRAEAMTGVESILFVDDEPALVSMGQEHLQSLGYQVTAVSGSLEALRLFLENPSGFDLVITDMTMPYMTGEKLAEEIFRIRPDMPVILCTGFSAKMDAQKAAGMGIRAFIEKPVLKRELSDAIRKVLGHTS